MGRAVVVNRKLQISGANLEKHFVALFSTAREQKSGGEIWKVGRLVE